MKKIIDEELTKLIESKDIEIDFIFCLKCNQGILTIKDYKKRTVICPTCNNKQIVRFYKNGKVYIRDYKERDKNE